MARMWHALPLFLAITLILVPLLLQCSLPDRTLQYGADWGPLSLKRNITNADLHAWRFLGRVTFSDLYRNRRGNLVLKFSDVGFPAPGYEVGATECQILRELEGAGANPLQFPRCLAHWVGSLNNAPLHTTVLTFMKGNNFSRAVEEADDLRLYRVTESLLNALQFLRTCNVVHRNLDESNVLVEGTTVKITDFALATSSKRPARGRTMAIGRKNGAVRHPPDYLLCGWDDVYSAGMMLRVALLQRGKAVTRGISSLVHMMTRRKCTDRLRDTPQLLDLLHQHGLTKDEVAPCFAVNKFVEPAGAVAVGKCLHISGYQGFRVCAAPRASLTPLLDSMALKVGALEAVNFSGSTVLDVGGNSGFYSLWAILHGATSAVVVDQDVGAVKAGMAAANVLRANLTYVSLDNAPRAAVVFAFAIVHWLVSCSESFGSLEAVMYFLRSLAVRALIVEWIDPADSAVKQFLHVDPGIPYSRALFVALLKSLFTSFSVLKETADHRELFVAYV
eukprot:GGOE01003063.1.p1 GENE.GGOE01003063.1~~GGOE01003063.1.p1  ORF type:complete len:505 (-),score=138.09 GGOE01003063.1:460-1974(-)